MKKIFFVSSCLAILTGFGVVVAADRQDAMPRPADTNGMKMKSSTELMSKNGMDMKGIDANYDGMISKPEFMTHHEKMYDSMKKNKDGQVDMKDMEMEMSSEKSMMNHSKK